MRRSRCQRGLRLSRDNSQTHPLGVAGEFFFLQSKLSVLTLTPCPLHTRISAVARKRSQSFCQKCRWQVTPKHAYTLDPMKSELAGYGAVQA